MAELNLIPSSMKKKYDQKNQRMNILFVIIILSAVLFFALYIPFISLHLLQNRESVLKAQVDAQFYIIEERNRLMDQMNRTNELVTLVDNFDKDKQLIYQYIVDLQAKLPDDISCTTLNYAEKTITISGKTENYKSPAVFVANLQETETYQNSNLVSITEEDSGYLFNITITLMK